MLGRHAEAVRWADAFRSFCRWCQKSRSNLDLGVPPIHHSWHSPVPVILCVREGRRHRFLFALDITPVRFITFRQFKESTAFTF